MTVTTTQDHATRTTAEDGLARRWQGAIAFEWTKLASVRSTWLSLALAVVITVGLSILFGASAKASAENGYDTAAPAPHLAFQAILIAQFLIIVTATLIITSEYSSRSITTTLQSVPVRGRMLGAKLIIIALSGFVTGVVLSVIGTLTASLFAQEYGHYTAGQFVGGALATGAYLTLLAMLVVGVGTALRSSAGTITSILFLLLILPQVLPLFNIEWLRTAADYLPTNASMVLVLHLSDPYGLPTALLVLIGWSAAAIVAGTLVLRGRDA